MPDPSKLPFLLQLLEDDSEVVRDALVRELAAYGPSLEEALGQLPVPPGRGPARRHAGSVLRFLSLAAGQAGLASAGLAVLVCRGGRDGTPGSRA